MGTAWSDPLKVLHLSAGNLYGGVETFLTTLARLRHLAPEMEPEFGLCFRGRLWDELAAAGVPVHDLGQARFSRPWTVVRTRRRLSRLLTAVKYQVVVCQMSWVQALFGGVAAHFPAGFVAHFHGPRCGGWLESLAGRFRPRLIIGPSRHTVESYRPFFPGVPLEVLNPPIVSHVVESPELLPGERAALRRQFAAGPDDVVILQASRIESWKGHDQVLKALGRLRDLPAWRFWVAGGVQRPSEESYSHSLRVLARELQIADRVEFLGQRADVPRLMRAADVYCQGNRGPEGFSSAFIEASFCALPIVTTDLGGAGEMIDAETGILLPPGEDVTALAGALRLVLTDPGRRAAMGGRAREKAIRLCDPRQQIPRLAGYLRAAAMTPSSEPPPE
jgi:glycosyltransferase involved in cell wall biosynthesis